MNLPIDVEKALLQLGNRWPANDSLAEGVLRELEARTMASGTPARRWPMGRSLVALAASVVALAVLSSVFTRSASLSAQVREAVQQARTFQMIIHAPASDPQSDEQLVTVSYERGVGFREDLPTEVAIGNSDGLWRYLKKAKLAIRSGNTSLAELVDRTLDEQIGQALKDAKYQRYSVGDEVIDGQSCEAYLLTDAQERLERQAQTQPPDQQRLIVLLDDRQRVARIITETQIEGRWVRRLINDWKYDVPLDRTLFQPNFPADVRVVDADVAFERFVDLDTALYREERKGLWYAIHRAERIENGGLFLISSVRGTGETLKKYPLTRRRLQPGMVFVDGPATNYRGSQEYRVPGMAIELASMDHQGINLRWWALVPMPNAGENPFETGAGKVKVPVGITPSGGAFGQAHFADSEGVLQHMTWEVELDVGEPSFLPSIETVAQEVYTDMKALEVVPFKFLNMGNRTITVPTCPSDLSNITSAEFVAAVVDDIRWWQAGLPTDDPRYSELFQTPARR